MRVSLSPPFLLLPRHFLYYLSFPLSISIYSYLTILSYTLCSLHLPLQKIKLIFTSSFPSSDYKHQTHTHTPVRSSSSFVPLFFYSFLYISSSISCFFSPSPSIQFGGVWGGGGVQWGRELNGRTGEDNEAVEPQWDRIWGRFAVAIHSCRGGCRKVRKTSLLSSLVCNFLKKRNINASSF